MAEQAAPQPAAAPARDKRSARETRLPISGAVKLISLSGKQREIEAELLDISIHGFRARHRQHDVENGQEFRVLYPWGEVIARMMWHRAVGEWVESGFRLSY